MVKLTSAISVVILCCLQACGGSSGDEDDNMSDLGNVVSSEDTGQASTNAEDVTQGDSTTNGTEDVNVTDAEQDTDSAGSADGETTETEQADNIVTEDSTGGTVLSSGVTVKLLTHTNEVVQPAGVTKRLVGISAATSHPSGLIAWAATYTMPSGLPGVADVIAGSLDDPQVVIGEGTAISGLPDRFAIRDVAQTSLASDGSMALLALVGVKQDGRDGSTISTASPLTIIVDDNGARVSNENIDINVAPSWIRAFESESGLSHSLAGTIYRDPSGSLRRHLRSGSDIVLDSGSDNVDGLSLDGCPIVPKARSGAPVMNMDDSGTVVMQIGFENRGLTDCPGLSKYAIVQLSGETLQALVLEGSEVTGAPGYFHYQVTLEKVFPDGGFFYSSVIEKRNERGGALDRRDSWWYQIGTDTPSLVYVEGEQLPFVQGDYAPNLVDQYPFQFDVSPKGSVLMSVSDRNTRFGFSNTGQEYYVVGGNLSNAGQQAVFSGQLPDGQPHALIDVPGRSAYGLVTQSVPSERSSGFGVTEQLVASHGEVIGFDEQLVIAALSNAYLDTNNAPVFFASLYDKASSQILGVHMLRKETDDRFKILLKPLDRIDVNGVSVLLRDLFSAINTSSGPIFSFDDGTIVLAWPDGLLWIKGIDNQ